MNIEKLKNNLWVPSNDAQIETWRETGYPFMQYKCLNNFLTWCDSQNKKFNTILDIGAWCGTWSLALQKYAKNIICYEPNKIHFTCLERNLAPYTHVTLQNQAIGNEDGFVRLLEEKATQNTRVLKEQGETIISKLDSLSLPSIDMIKIDVEGLELEVLKGANRTLKDVQFIMIELNNNSKKYGSSNLEIEDYIENKLGYKILIKTWPDTVYFK